MGTHAALGTNVSVFASSGSSAPAWTPASINDKLLFWGVVSEISGGQMPNKVTDATDYLTVEGSPATYQCPDTAEYIAADTDYIWFTIEGTQRTTTTAELIGYDFQRTPVKYLDDSPNTIQEIIILKAGETLTESELNNLFAYMHLSIWWNDAENSNGYIKDNRVEYSHWIPDTPLCMLDTNKTIGLYRPLEVGGETVGANNSLIWWDLTVGSSTLGAEQNSGNTILYAVYKITACTDNFFYSGCAIGDTFVCGAVKTCTADNKVQRYTGNHLGQYTVPNIPVEAIFDGFNDYMKTAPVTLPQPTTRILVVKQITWTISDCFSDGALAFRAGFYQSATTPNILIYAGASACENDGLPVGQLGILRGLFWGASSELQVNNNDPVLGNSGTGTTGGFVIGSAGDGTAAGNVYVPEAILSKVAYSDADKLSIYTYLSKKYRL